MAKAETLGVDELRASAGGDQGPRAAPASVERQQRRPAPSGDEIRAGGNPERILEEMLRRGSIR
jgi:hypothetical protein